MASLRAMACNLLAEDPVSHKALLYILIFTIAGGTYIYIYMSKVPTP